MSGSQEVVAAAAAAVVVVLAVIPTFNIPVHESFIMFNFSLFNI